MKNVITKPNRPALLSNKVEVQKQQQSLFRKHNFCVTTLDGVFRPFSYEASYAGDTVEITIINASNGNKVKVLAPSISLIAKKATSDRSFKKSVVVYEDFCDALFDFICDHIMESEDFAEGEF